MQIERDILRAESELGDIANKLERIQRDLDSLEDSRNTNLTAATIAAISAASGPLASAIRSVRLARRVLSGSSPSLDQALRAIPYVGGGIGAALGYINAYKAIRGIQKITGDLRDAENQQKLVQDRLRRLQASAKRIGCDQFLS